MTHLVPSINTSHAFNFQLTIFFLSCHDEYAEGILFNIQKKIVWASSIELNDQVAAKKALFLSTVSDCSSIKQAPMVLSFPLWTVRFKARRLIQKFKSSNGSLSRSVSAEDIRQWSAMATCFRPSSLLMWTLQINNGL